MLQQNQTLTVGVTAAKGSLRVNRNEPVILGATVYSRYPHNLSYAWSSDPAIDPVVFASGTNEKYLKVPENTLSSDLRYAFTCAVQDPAGNSGNATVKLEVNRAPRLGSFAVSPASGVADDTSFTLSAIGWNDDDLPLQYRFSYEDPSVGTYFPIGERSASGTVMVTSLPDMISKSAKSATIQLRLEVFDALNATAESYAQVELSRGSGTTSAAELLQLAGNASLADAERLHALLQVGKQLNCSNVNQTDLCGETVLQLRTLELSMMDVSIETEETILNVLSSLNMTSSDYLGRVVDTLSDVAAREATRISQALSVADSQLESKKTHCGLPDSFLSIMLYILGNATAGMSSTQLQSSQQQILAVADALGRSLIKDSVPGEPAGVMQSGAVTILAKKVKGCSNDSKTDSETVRGVGFMFPICSILPVWSTVEYTAKLNKVSPYDLVVEVFDQNVVGDCVPLSSKMSRVEMYNDESKTLYTASSITGNDVQLTFQLSDPGFPSDELSHVQCVYYDTASGDFTPSTMRTEILSVPQRTFICRTSHLSEFTMRYSAISPTKSYIDAEFWILLGLLLLCISSHVWAAVRDSADKLDIMKELEERTQQVAAKLAQRFVQGLEDSSADQDQEGKHAPLNWTVTGGAYMSFAHHSRKKSDTSQSDRVQIRGGDGAGREAVDWRKMLGLVFIV